MSDIETKFDDSDFFYERSKLEKFYKAFPPQKAETPVFKNYASLKVLNTNMAHIFDDFTNEPKNTYGKS